MSIMKVPAQFVTKGMVTADHGLVLAIGHSEGLAPIVIETIGGRTRHHRGDLVTMSSCYRLEIQKKVNGAYSSKSFTNPFVSDLERAAEIISSRLFMTDTPGIYGRAVYVDGTVTRFDGVFTSL